MENIKDAHIFIVMQAGSSSGEEYVHAFNSSRQAARYIRSAEAAAYKTSLAHAVPIPELADLQNELIKTTRWLKEMKMQNTPRFKDIQRTLLRIPPALRSARKK